jgi:hypothetical protein
VAEGREGVTIGKVVLDINMSLDGLIAPDDAPGPIREFFSGETLRR